MFKNFWGSQEQQAQSDPEEAPTQAWYPSSLIGSSSSSRPSTTNSSFSSPNVQRPSDRQQSSSQMQFSPAEAAGMINLLKDKSVDELRKLLSDKDAYYQFLLSLDVRKNNLRDELRKETLQLTRENLEKQPRIMELTNQCRIIRTTEVAAAKEKLNDLEKQKEETLRYSPSMLLLSLQDASNKAEEESDSLHQQLLEREVDMVVFVQKYKKLRTAYHKRVLTQLAAKTSSV